MWCVLFDVKTIRLSQVLVFEIKSALLTDIAMLVYFIHIADIRVLLAVIRYFFIFVFPSNLKKFQGL